MKTPTVLPKLFLTGFAVAAISAAGGHFLFPELIAGSSAWGLAPGWQREIAFFDLFLASLCISAILQSDLALTRALCLGLPFLSAMLGANHGMAYAKTGLSLHLLWCALNVLSIFFGVSSFRVLPFRATPRSHDFTE